MFTFIILPKEKILYFGKTLIKTITAFTIAHSITLALSVTNIFQLPQSSAEALIAEWEGKPAAFAVFFENFSTFKGRSGLYLEDVYVEPEYRQKGIGKALLAYLAQIAVERECPRFEWVVLDWNQNAIDFYESFGAKKMEGLLLFRISGDNLEKLASASY